MEKDTYRELCYLAVNETVISNLGFLSLMFQSGKLINKAVTKESNIFLIILMLLLCLSLLATNASAKQSTDEINVPGFWAAAKDFWEFLSSSDRPEKNLTDAEDVQDKDKQLVEIISDELNTSQDVEDEDLGLVELTNNPVCKEIYVADYLPTFNQEAIQKCQKLIEQENFKVLFNQYVAELCQQTDKSSLSRSQIAQIQLRLRKYSLTFPQANFLVNPEEIDGIYGSKTCNHIAHYQIASQSSLINGQPDQLLYDQLVNTIPLSKTEIKELSATSPKTKKLSDKNKQSKMTNNQTVDYSMYSVPEDTREKQS